MQSDTEEPEEIKESELKKMAVVRSNEASKVSTACTIEDLATKAFPSVHLSKTAKPKKRSGKSVNKYRGVTKKSTQKVTATSSTIQLPQVTATDLSILDDQLD